MSRFAGFLILTAVTASAGTMPSVGVAEVRFRTVDFAGVSPKLLDKLRDGFYADFADQRGVATVSRTVARSYVKDTDAKDWAEADEALVKFATDRRIDAQYGMFVLVWLEQEGSELRTYLKMSARVVRKDGWKARSVTAKLPKGTSPLPGVFKATTAQLLRELELAELPVTIEVPRASPIPAAQLLPFPPAPAPPPLHDAGSLSGGSAPFEVSKQAAAPSPLKYIGYGGLLVGGAALAAGLVTFLAVPHPQKDSAGNVLEADLGAIQAARNMHGAGVGLMVAGGVLAVAGGGILLWAPPGNEVKGQLGARVRAMVMPTGSGAALVVGGAY